MTKTIGRGYLREAARTCVIRSLVPNPQIRCSVDTYSPDIVMAPDRNAQKLRIGRDVMPRFALYRDENTRVLILLKPKPIKTTLFWLKIRSCCKQDATMLFWATLFLVVNKLGDLKTRKSTGTSCQTSKLSIICFGSKFLVDL